MTMQVTLVGNVTRDPELKYTPGGHAVLNFSIADNSRVKDEQGEWVDGNTSFYDITVWRDMAENVAESIQKGTRVIVVGRQEVRDYERKDGTKGRAVEITADEVGPSLKWATASVAKTQGGQGKAPAPKVEPEYSEADF